MALSRDIIVRRPIMAGRFYEADHDRCAADAARWCAEPLGDVAQLPPVCRAAIVPHAGWVCSGRIAGGTFRSLASHTTACTFIITGSVHTMQLDRPALDEADAWRTPLGDVSVDAELRDAISQFDEFDVLDAAHRHEHSVEVNLPFMQTVFGPAIRIVPCMIPPHELAPRWGEAIGRLLAEWPQPVAMICSVDLTHYGPNYDFEPGGSDGGTAWADENDRRLLALIERLDAGAIVHEAESRRSSCGGGAIAATVAAAKAMGAARGRILEHTNSSRELAALGYDDRRNSVGYAGVIF